MPRFKANDISWAEVRFSVHPASSIKYRHFLSIGHRDDNDEPILFLRGHLLEVSP